MSSLRTPKVFLTILAAIFLVPIGYFAWQSHAQKVGLAALLAEVEQVRRTPGTESCLLTGQLESPSQAQVSSPTSQHPCLAFAVELVLEELTSDHEDLVYTSLPLVQGQVSDLRFSWQDQSYPLNLAGADLGLWMREAKPISNATYPSASLPDYFPEASRDAYKGRESLKYELSEYALVEGQQVTVLAEVNSGGSLIGGRYPLILVPGDEAQFVSALRQSVDFAAEDEKAGMLVMGFVLLMGSVFVFAMVISSGQAAKPKVKAAQEGDLPPLWARLTLLVLVILVMTAGALLPKYLGQ